MKTSWSDAKSVAAFVTLNDCIEYRERGLFKIRATVSKLMDEQVDQSL